MIPKYETIVLAFVALSLLATPCYSNQEEFQPTTEIDVNRLNLDDLSDWGVREYVFTDEVFDFSGTVRMETQVEAERVLFRDTTEIVCKGELIRITVQSVHRPDSLFLVQAALSVEMEPDLWCDIGKGSSVTSPDLKFIQRSDGSRFPLNIPETALPQGVLLRLVPLLSRDPGRVWRIPPWLDLIAGRIKKDWVIVCSGTYKSKDKEGVVTAFQIRPRSPGVPGLPVLTVWVDESGQVVQWGWPGRKMHFLKPEPE